MWGIVTRMIHKREERVMDWKERIESNPEVCHGTACIKGTRIMVSVILDNLSDGLAIDDIIREYPPLTREDVLAAINYAAELARERIIPIGKLVS